MQKIEKIVVCLAVVNVLVVIVAFGIIANRNQSQETGSVAYNTAPTIVVASSTAMTVTNSSVRLAATSTTRRLGLLVQPLACPTNGGVFIRANRDVVATANTGLFAAASTTLQLEDYPGPMTPQGSIQGIAPLGPCTVLVTEFLSQY